MVALHTRKLSHKELFRGVLWTDTDWRRMRDGFIAELKAKGVEEPELRFAASRMMEDYQRKQPSMKERQQIVARIYPPKRPSPRLDLTDAEIDWLADHLAGINDPVGRDILDKLETQIAGRPEAAP